MTTHAPSSAALPIPPSAASSADVHIISCMEVSVNGQRTAITAPCRVTDLLQQLQMHHHPCAVEINHNLVPRREHDQVLLSDGDTIEIVTLVGGG